MKPPRRSILVGLAALLLCAAIAFRALVRASSPFSWDVYVLWVLAPYAVLLAGLLIPWGDPDRRARTGCVTALIVLAVSHFVYRDASAASTGGLIFALPADVSPSGKPPALGPALLAGTVAVDVAVSGNGETGRLNQFPALASLIRQAERCGIVALARNRAARRDLLDLLQVFVVQLDVERRDVLFQPPLAARARNRHHVVACRSAATRAPAAPACSRDPRPAP